MLAGLVLGFLPGCGTKSKRLKVYPASGQVLVNGKPAAGVFVYLWPANVPPELDAYCPTGQTDESGRYTLSTYEQGDGSPAGTYTVTAEWPIRYNPISTQWEGDRLKGRYKSAGTSKIQVTVPEGPTELPTINLDG